MLELPNVGGWLGSRDGFRVRCRCGVVVLAERLESERVNNGGQK